MIQKRYDSLSRLLHWSMAAIIIYTTVAGYVMHLVVGTMAFDVLSVLNMSFATIGTVLFIMRWVWSYFRPKVESVNSTTTFEKNIAKFIHSVIYLLMFLVFVSGYLMLKEPYWFFWLVKIPNPVTDMVINDFFFFVHRASCAVLGIVVVMHIGAALYHQFWLRDNLLARLMPPKPVVMHFSQKKGRV
ncbi:cytochrome b/b6 domain-containing protein [Grimontia kaedaensis]|uniref:Cytochrome b/b6 domain-containing protein n=1 Tax=Grimontia kaedaensis TaxID=2872157 RepID=A0ABY4WS51_9GAMM|nr:cytochrome b/b6 domain-containing protein [Grimontia kaedaensis]USH02294.1 cytochrome b/b6 domain-containing protein [Grimontia kaedaensis]